MEEVLNEVDKLIEEFRYSYFVKQMIESKSKIDKKIFDNTSDIKEIYKNEFVHLYLQNQDILDYHIYYLNKEINKLIDNKICKEHL